MQKKFLCIVLLSLSMLIILGCSNQITKENVKEMNTLEEIKKRKKIIIATEAIYPPYEFVQEGKIVGYGSDILAEIVKNLGVELEQHDMDFKGILPSLDTKKVDLVATVIVVSPERKEKYSLTTPIGISEYVYVKKVGNDELTSKDQLPGKKIGCVTGGNLETKLNKYKDELIKEGKETFEIVSFTNMPEAFLGLKNGQVDVILSSKVRYFEIMREIPDTYEIFAPFKDEKDYITWAVRKEDKELLDFVNTEILKLKKSGKLAELQEKWFGYTSDLPDEI